MWSPGRHHPGLSTSIARRRPARIIVSRALASGRSTPCHQFQLSGTNTAPVRHFRNTVPHLARLANTARPWRCAGGVKLKRWRAEVCRKPRHAMCCVLGMPRSQRLAPWPGVAPPALPSMEPRIGPERERDLERVRTLTRVLDHYLVDPLLGLFLPGSGDLIGSLLGLYLVGLAVRRRTSPVVIARMLLNLALDAGLGFVPIIGDLADFAFKANEKNLALLSERSAGGKATSRARLAVG